MGCGSSKPASGGSNSGVFKALDGLFVVEKQLGEGATATVYLCKTVKTGAPAACKVMRLDVEEDLEDFEHEVKLWTPLKHRSIVALLHSVIDKQNKRGYMVLSACTGGELFDWIANGVGSGRPGTECDAAMAILDCLSALQYLHSKRIIHRDLKPENLLFKDKDAGSPLQVIDFGIAEELPKGVDTSPNVVGTTSYMSPEVLEGKGGIPSDMWSIGCIVYFMLSGTLPFNGRSEEDKEAAIMKGAYAMPDSRFKNVSSDAKDFINQLLKKDPKDRMTAEQAMNHPWITERTKRAEHALGPEVMSSLKAYAEANRFQQAVRHHLATHLTGAELHRLRNVFASIDTTSTGLVSIEALEKVIKEDPHLAGLDVKAFDLSGDGQVDWREFVAGAMQQHELSNDDNLEKVFKDLDTNKDGTLSVKEIAASFGPGEAGEDKLAREKLARELLETIGDGDSVMTLAEFKEHMKKSAPKAEEVGQLPLRKKTGKKTTEVRA